MKERLIMCGIISIFFFVLITGFALAAADNPLDPSTSNNSEGYSQEITITENSGETLTDYQVPIYLNSFNFNFSQAKEDGSDLRFSSRGRTLSYWIETWDPETEEAIIWVKIPSLPANKDTTLLLKYGNPADEAISNGGKTFEFFDDFEGNKLQGLIWNSETAGGGLVEVKNGICHVTAPKPHAYDYSTIYTKKSFGINSMFVVKRMKVTTGKDERGPVLRQGFIDQIKSRKNEITHETQYANESRVSWETAYSKEKFNSFDKTDVRVPEGQWYTSGIAWYEENDTRHVAWFKNGVRNAKMDYSSNEYITNFPMRIYLYAESYSDVSKNTGYMAVDYAFVRKFVVPEPTVSFAPDQMETGISAGDNTHDSGSVSESETILPESETSPEADTVSPEASNTGGNSDGNVSVQESHSGNDTEPRKALFPDYQVGISGIKLSSPYRSEFPVLEKELKSSRIDTIFLSINGPDAWQYERFVKTAHERGISVHAVLLESLNCTSETATRISRSSLNSVLDYNEKSLAPFDGVNIYVKTSPGSGTGSSCMDYKPLFELANERAGESISLSASIPTGYSGSGIENISPLVDFFIVRAYDTGAGDLNSTSNIVDTVAPEMGEIRGSNSSGIIEISVEEGFENQLSIQNLFASFEEYYGEDPAFKGVSISSYDKYTALPVDAASEQNKFSLPGFKVFSVLLAGLGVFGFLKMKRK
ncbi:DUF2341 domain-containing protein [Methanosarcina hadiensis]|uniref:DUF2341 domain-containing protein n=1 Tax=Methanosarcina hadiensis TaxID=3078083 RepID=UPI003977BCD7